ncbi:MAG: VCBS repeat-containing protein [Nitrospirae bacterium]|nr:VCBS repeat-containing protein [Candidatus Troglogloeales bacterium]
MATANFGSNDVSILLGDGTGSFGPATGFDVGLGPVSIAIGDFNGDGKPDLTTANLNSNDVSILINQ